MISPLQSIVIAQLEMIRTSLMLTQQMMEAFVSVQKQVGQSAHAGRGSVDSDLRDSDLSRFLTVKSNGCIGPADLKS